MGLPPPADNQSYWKISAIEAGRLTMPSQLFIDPCPAEDAKLETPSLAFLLHHSTTDKYLLFDMGVRKDYENYPPSVAPVVRAFEPLSVPQDIIEGLERGGLKPDDIEYVCLSHIHWDHTGNTRLFGTSKFLIGKDAIPLIETGYPKSADSHFENDIVPLDRTTFLDPADGQWKPLGPFPNALDFLGDGSLYIVDTPGHLPGHITILARTSADGGWVYLAGDAAHHWRLVTGESTVAVSHDHSGNVMCAHVDKEVADITIGRIQALYKIPRVRIILAHAAQWWKENRDGPSFLPGHIESL